MTKAKQPLGIYIHIPFCKQKCHYCDFHFSVQRSYVPRMMKAMLAELELRRTEWEGQSIPSIYFGGGTPSIIPTEDIAAFISTIRDAATVLENAEITLEANPDDIQDEALRAWHTAGVNRLSVGIQSFHPAQLEHMNRAHAAEEAMEALNKARDHGFDTFSVDLIYGLPRLEGYALSSDIEQMTGLGAQHISAYALTIEEGTVFAHLEAQGKLPLPQEERLEEEYLMVVDRLARAGYQQYEVSNFALAGHEAVHNSAYWSGRSYLGIGPSAHSYSRIERSWNIANNHGYMSAIEVGERPSESEIIDKVTAYNEYILTHSRTAQGIHLAEVQERFQVDILASFSAALDKYSDYIIRDVDRLRLNTKGLFRADGFAAELFR